MSQQTTSISQNKSSIIGIWYSLAAFIIWGFLPLYWKALQQVSAGEILAHRILWSFIFCAVILTIYGRWTHIKEALATNTTRIGVLLSGAIISANWFIYIWAVNHERVVEASLGYYINPLLTILIGILFLKEKLNFWQLVSLLMAFIGVIIITTQYGQVPWISLSLALTFTLYGLAKKLVKVDSIIGLTLETVLVTPIALIFLLFEEIQGVSSFSLSPLYLPILLVLSGVVTATPLLFYAQGAKRVSLSTMGFIQYLGPSISLLLGVVVFGEPFTKVHAWTFGFIWAGVLLFTFSGTKFLKNRQPRRFKV